MPDMRTPQRLQQLDASFRALGCDSWNTWWDKADRLTHCRVSWSDATGADPIIVHLTSKLNDLTIMVQAGQEMSRRLAEERPDVEVPDVVWT